MIRVTLLDRWCTNHYHPFNPNPLPTHLPKLGLTIAQRLGPSIGCHGRQLHRLIFFLRSEVDEGPFRYAVGKLGGHAKLLGEVISTIPVTGILGLLCLTFAYSIIIITLCFLQKLGSLHSLSSKSAAALRFSFHTTAVTEEVKTALSMVAT
ncbi:hypothetical protein BHE74_00001800 [Ensete ventricosum]|uniref:Uncharacterized protein n=1 Tax=Ensete ventricosum TaxID=4639 RepID=A0A444EQ72_ENSVE|nr:hypothetical protein GW17_00023765 [Ensete ventricosum]RWW89256.1 hypothetical protein BHE74_00001800 [Ensete ventricosum]RZR71258.1 hypothetical protein BHM03_00004259 [Ensete ventricosum]